MSERDDRYARDDVPGLPSSTAEFRAMPDASASTAQFQAFAAGYDRSEARRPGPAASWPGQPWDSGRGGSRRAAALVIGGLAAIALVVVILVAAFGG